MRLSYPWRRPLSLLFLLTASTLFPARAQVWEWVARGAGPNVNNANAITKDALGSFYVVGSFTTEINIGGTILTGGPQADVFVAKIDSFGLWEWAVRLGGAGADRGGSITVDAARNVFITGTFEGTSTFGSTTLTSAGSSDVFVARLSGTTGAVQWAVRGGGAGADAALSTTVDRSGHVFIGGRFSGASAAFGTTTLANAGAATTTDAFIARLNTSNGAWQWASKVGGAGNDVISALALDPLGNPLAAGFFASRNVAFGATTLANGGGSNTDDLFVAKINTTGTTWQWATKAGGSANDQGFRLVTDVTGNAYLTGTFTGRTTAFGSTILSNAGATGTMDAFAAKISTAGAWQWATRAGGPGQDLGDAIALSGTQIVIAGRFTGTSTFGNSTLTSAGPGTQNDVFVARLSGTGSWQYAMNAGGVDDDYPTGLAVDGAGNAIVCGDFRSPSMPFGGITLLNSSGDYNFFVARLNEHSLTATPPHLAPASFSLYPNPSRGEVVRARGLTGPVQVLDALGRVVREQKATADETLLDIAGLPPGVYVVRNAGRIRRLVIE